MKTGVELEGGQDKKGGGKEGMEGGGKIRVGSEEGGGREGREEKEEALKDVRKENGRRG